MAYFWLRLKRDFFKRHDIQIIESMPNGKDYILLYLKLLCESVDHEGMLRFSDEIPYSEDMIATITGTDNHIVYDAMQYFVDLGLIEILEDGTFYRKQASKMIGTAEQDEHTRESARLRAKAYRDRKKAEKSDDNVSVTLPSHDDNVIRHGDIDIEKELEKELETEKEIREKSNYQEIVAMYNDLCRSFPRITSLSDARKKAIKARLKTYSLDDFKTMFEKAEASSFLKGKNDRNWSATFDWMIKDSNMAKILDGNYDDRSRQGKRLDESYQMMSQWAEEGD